MKSPLLSILISLTVLLVIGCTTPLPEPPCEPIKEPEVHEVTLPVRSETIIDVLAKVKNYKKDEDTVVTLSDTFPVKVSIKTTNLSVIESFKEKINTPDVYKHYFEADSKEDNQYFRQLITKYNDKINFGPFFMTDEAALRVYAQPLPNESLAFYQFEREVDRQASLIVPIKPEQRLQSISLLLDNLQLGKIKFLSQQVGRHWVIIKGELSVLESIADELP